jgi:hypothetical protein
VDARAIPLADDGAAHDVMIVLGEAERTAGAAQAGAAAREP